MASSKMISLKDLIYKEDKELSLWYQQYRHNLINLLENVSIDKEDSAARFRIIISDEFDEFYKLFTNIAPNFTHKNIKGK